MLKELCSRDNDRRAFALRNLRGQLPRLDSTKLSNLLIEHLLHDPSRQVRRATITAIIENFEHFINEEGVKSLFQNLERLLAKELEFLIRYDAIRLLDICGQRFGNLQIKLFTAGPGEQLECRLVEGVCILLGIYIGDTNKYNRALACDLLGNCSSIPSPILLALLSKEASTPTLVDDDKELRLPWSFCGSCIIALEDEFEMVRLAAIRALAKLSRDRKFAEKAFDFFVDSFQDESAVVRIASFTELSVVLDTHAMVVPLGHFESILSHLDDTEAEARSSVRRLVAVSRICDEESLVKLFRCVSFALSKYSTEAEEYFRELAAFGKLNSTLIGESLVRIMKTSKFYIIPEPKIEDITYTVRLVAVLAALWARQELDSGIPAFVYRHYHYLKAKYPKVFVSFIGHTLRQNFYSTLKDFNRKTSSLEELQFRIIDRINGCLRAFVKGQTCIEPLMVLQTNIEYNAAGFTPGFQQLLLKVIDAINSRSPVEQVLIEFEKISEQVTEAIQQIDAYLKDPTKICPILPISSDIIQLRAILQPLVFSKENPMKSRGRLPIHINLKGNLSCPTNKSLQTLVSIPDVEPLLFPLHLDDQTFASNFKIPAALLATLEAPAVYRIDFQIVAGEVMRPLGPPIHLYLERINP